MSKSNKKPYEEKSEMEQCRKKEKSKIGTIRIEA